MALKNKSDIDMISGPEFINLQPLDINPLMATCQIKVFYLGHNRNGSYINRDTADKMAKTLRGTPIVARWIKKKEDYGDHGQTMKIEDGEIEFGINTIPYGFVSPEAEVWYQNFIDTDEFGNQVERTYLMTTGYLWEGQFKEELAKVLEEGQPHSMELDSNSIDGHWAKDNNLGVEFFIINDAVFSKLCILGDDVEPCFEGSSVTATSSEVGERFSLEKIEEYSRTLFAMMNELTDAIQSKGGLEMPNKFAEQTETVDEKSTDFEATEEVVKTEEVVEEAVDYTEAEEAPAEAEGEFAKNDDDKDDSDDADSSDSDSKDKDEEDDEEKKPASKNTLESLEVEFEALKSENESLRAEVETLREFKLTVENEQKDALMDSWPYNTLSEEDKADVIAHKSEYSLDEIKAKLAVIYVEKGVQFTAEAQEETQEDSAEDAITTFSLDGEVAEVESDFQRALRATRKN